MDAEEGKKKERRKICVYKFGRRRRRKRRRREEEEPARIWKKKKKKYEEEKEEKEKEKETEKECFCKHNKHDSCRYLVPAKDSFLNLIKYISGSYDSEKEHEYSKDSGEGSFRRLFYLELPPSIIFKEDFRTKVHGGYFDQYGGSPLGCYGKACFSQFEHIRDERVKKLSCYAAISFDFSDMRPSISAENPCSPFKSGYRDDPTVPDDSNTPTFAAVILRIHNERWEGVPFILKAGKALNSRKTELRVQFKDVPGDIFKDIPHEIYLNFPGTTKSSLPNH
ncbi:hypothetical protein Ahy_B10g102204 [Arachis hypogaea]|uniref:glucose-6-phosphate dehydrogenase (NADP(+)) n=1 Tax=Arachis hypogaea TaxID=3818 RepID=A0A444X1B4_ARAHY|nr:hypothetical protein Ahy_B10g102204 [Arachis hypogaea]